MSVTRHIPTLVVFNKTDAFTYTPKDEDDLTPVRRENIPLEELERTWMAKLGATGGTDEPKTCLFVSAKQKQNIDELRAVLYRQVKQIHIQRYPYNDFLFRNYEEDTE